MTKDDAAVIEREIVRYMRRRKPMGFIDLADAMANRVRGTVQDVEYVMRCMLEAGTLEHRDTDWKIGLR